MTRCTLCQGSGYNYRPKLTNRYQPCRKCHTTGVQHAAHTLVIATRSERAKL